MEKPQPQPVPLLQHRVLLKVAVAAEADMRTVRKYLAGEPVRPYLAERIKAGLAAVGVSLEPAPAQP